MVSIPLTDDGRSKRSAQVRAGFLGGEHAGHARGERGRRGGQQDGDSADPPFRRSRAARRS
jgi:hypothetical protein